MIITFDGPAGVGKSTVARLTADKLNLPFLNTGAMFRCIALAAENNPDTYNVPDLTSICSSFEFNLEGSGNSTLLYCNGNLVGDEIRTEKIAALASKLALRKDIRACLLQKQRELGKKTSLVAEGRDMGTLVFPEAEHKFFLEADAAVRAKRRWLELSENSPTQSLQELEQTIRERDKQDRNRPIAPLKPASDALVIDTSNMTIDEVLKTVLHQIN